MPIYKGSTKLGTIYHGGTKIEKVYKGSTLVHASEKNFVVKYIKQGDYMWAQGLLGDSIYKPGQQLLFGTLGIFPSLLDPFSFTIKKITPTSLTDSAGNVYPAKRVVYIGEIPFIGWRRPNTQIYTGCDELLTAPGALIGDTALVGGIGLLGGGTVVTSDDGVTISFTAYNSAGVAYQAGSFQRSTSTLSSNYLYRGQVT